MYWKSSHLESRTNNRLHNPKGKVETLLQQSYLYITCKRIKPNNLVLHLQVEQDFQIIHPAVEGNMYAKWEDISKKIIAYCPASQPSWRSQLCLDVDLSPNDLSAGTCMYETFQRLQDNKAKLTWYLPMTDFPSIVCNPSHLTLYRLYMTV